jgi:hypothetical protein
MLINYISMMSRFKSALAPSKCDVSLTYTSEIALARPCVFCLLYLFVTTANHGCNIPKIKQSPKKEIRRTSKRSCFEMYENEAVTETEKAMRNDWSLVYTL